MDVARCTRNDMIFCSLAFNKLEKKYLICLEWGGPAFFRKASRSGEATSLGVRPHEMFL